MAYISNYKFTKKQKRYLKIKRVLDIFFAILLLIPGSVVMGLSMVWIKKESNGPAIFEQRRPGYHQKIFSIYKLRSMRIETTNKAGEALTDQEKNDKIRKFCQKNKYR